MAKALAPPTEAEVKEILEFAAGWSVHPDDAWGRVVTLCDAYLAQRETLEKIAAIHTVESKNNAGMIARAALSAAPLAPETQNEGEK